MEMLLQKIGRCPILLLLALSGRLFIGNYRLTWRLCNSPPRQKSEYRFTPQHFGITIMIFRKPFNIFCFLCEINYFCKKFQHILRMKNKKNTQLISVKNNSICIIKQMIFTVLTLLLGTLETKAVVETKSIYATLYPFHTNINLKLHHQIFLL